MPKYWENSADLSCDSSAESTHDSAGSIIEYHGGDSASHNPPLSMSYLSPAIERAERTPSGSIEEVDRSAQSDGTVSQFFTNNATLPTLEPHQHASLFYLSLIEGRCRTQAMSTINHRRSMPDCVNEDSPEVTALAEPLFAETLRELIRAGMVPEEFSSRPLPELRTYLRSFDAILHGLTTPLQNIAIPDRYKPIEDRRRDVRQDSLISDVFERSGHEKSDIYLPTRSAQLGDTSTSMMTESESVSNSHRMNLGTASHALVPRSRSHLLLMKQNAANHGLHSFVDPHSAEISLPKSVFLRDYETTALLGKGGFGKVVKVRSYLDRAEYAIKKIRCPAPKLRQLARDGDIQDLLNEVQALAQYNHQHVVRYYHAWVETETSQPPRKDDCLDVQNRSQADTNHSRVNTTKSSNLTSTLKDLENLALEDQQAINDVLRVQQEQNALAFDLNSSHVVFERDSSPVLQPQRSFFRSANVRHSSDSDEVSAAKSDSDDETGSTISLSRHLTTDTALVPKRNSSFIPTFADCFIYIKMAPYPLTLADYIYPVNEDNFDYNESSRPTQHCFHPLPTIRLLSRTLSGLAYLHRKQQIHRDLKPANIFLSILEEGEPPDKAWVNVSDCPDCSGTRDLRKPCYVSPCIGDFGLVVDLKAYHKDSSVVTSDTAELVPTDGDIVADVQPKTPGTKLYIPPNQSTHNIICPKLDVYALGIILLELTQKFDTKSERMIVLERARQGQWPADLEKNAEMARGIKGMLEPDREKRWSCEGVQMWAEKMELSLSTRL